MQLSTSEDIQKTSKEIISCDLSILYSVTALALTRQFSEAVRLNQQEVLQKIIKENFRNEAPRIAALLRGFRKCGNTQDLLPVEFLPVGPDPLNPQRIQIFSGMEHFYRVVAMDKYYCGFADEAIHDSELSYFSQVLNDAVLVELCGADGRKTLSLLEKIGFENGPEEIHYTDIVPANNDQAAKKTEATARIKEFDIRREEIADEYQRNRHYHPKRKGKPRRITTTSGDIRKEVFWKALAQKLKSVASSKIVVLMQGATFNDFSLDEMRTLLKHLRKHLPPQTIFLISFDNSTIPEIVADGYNTYPLKQWGLMALTQKYPKFDPGRAKAHVRAQPEEDRIKVVMEYETENAIHAFAPILKVPYNDQHRTLFEEAGFNIVRRMPYIDNPQKPRFPKIDYAFYAFRWQRILAQGYDK